MPVIPAPGNVTPIPSASLGYKPGETIFIHPSRVVRLTGMEYPDIEAAPDAWGDSALQPVHDAIRDAGLVSAAIANLVSRANVDLVKIPGLTQALSSETGTQKYIERFTTDYY